MNDKYLYTNAHSLSHNICSDLIVMFENSTKKYKGITMDGTNNNVKDTMDLMIEPDNPEHKKYHDLLTKELKYNLQKYANNLQHKDFNNEGQNTNETFTILPNGMRVLSFQIQKYNQNVGKYIYHNDFAHNGKLVRVITFLWYLNTVVEGGETAFGDYTIKPEAGKLVLFPATWTYPHCGKIPLSSDKYIITGWVYIEHKGE